MRDISWHVHSKLVLTLSVKSLRNMKNVVNGLKRDTEIMIVGRDNVREI